MRQSFPPSLQNVGYAIHSVGHDRFHRTDLRLTSIDTLNEQRHDKTNEMSVGPAKTDQPGHSPSLIRIFAVRMKKAWVLNYLLSAQRRLWSDWADAQADLSLPWAYTQFAGFVTSQLKFRFFVRCLNACMYVSFLEDHQQVLKLLSYFFFSNKCIQQIRSKRYHITRTTKYAQNSTNT